MNLKDFKEASSLIGKKVTFTATCMLFPKTGITGKVMRLEYAKNNELVYIIKTLKQGLEIQVGSNTSGLTVNMM